MAGGWELPEFDRVEKETLHASHAYSPGDSTLFSMPQAILGVRAADVPNGCDLMITPFDTGKTTTFNGLPTVFSSARALGFNTALLGLVYPLWPFVERPVEFLPMVSVAPV